MACRHIVEAAQEKIDELTLEKEKYTQAKSDIEDIKTIIDRYRAYFEKVATYLGYIIVNYQPFQQEGCNAQVAKLNSINTQLDSLIQDLTTAEEEVQDEIDDQEAIKKSGDKCADCIAAEAAAEAARRRAAQQKLDGTTTGRVGGGPVSIVDKKNLLY